MTIKRSPTSRVKSATGYLTGSCQLPRSQWRYKVNDVKRKPLRNRGERDNGMGEMKRKRGKERDDRDGSREKIQKKK